VAKVLEQEGYLASVTAGETDGKSTLTLELKYYQDRPVIERIERVSRPGLRIFKRVDELPVVQGGLGVAIVSTSQGVMTNVQAKAQGHGGEVLCIVL
jgi:small subunit ribosomal protein S8